jgi:hypothetical protein
VTDRGARNLLIVLTIAVAATRLMALSHSMWDWDEAQFSAALRHYNVANHNPHPPGFPLFIGAAKLVRFVIHDDFRALRTLNLLVSFFLFPAVFAFGRSCGLSFRVAAGGALVYSFLPNVVYWGGTAMSDISAATVFAAGAALLMRDATRRSLIGGSAIFAASMLIRPQNVIGAYPWFVSSYRHVRAVGRRGWITVAGAALLVVAIVAAGYGIAASKTGWDDYVDAVKWHQKYVKSVDGYANPDRPPSLSGEMLNLFCVNPVNAAGLPVLAALAAIAIFIPRRSHLHIVGTFLPQMVFVLFMLNPMWANRFSIAYMAGHSLLAISAADIILGAVAARARVSARVAAALTWTVAGGTAIASAVWVAPAIREVRRHDSPPVEAIRWITRNLDPGSTVLYVHSSFPPFANYFLDRYTKIFVEDDFEKPGQRVMPNSYYIADHPAFGTTLVFQRKRARHLVDLYSRYHEASVAPIDTRITYGSGWYAVESDGAAEWRWMRRTAHLFVESTGKPMRVTLKLYAPIDAEAAPVVTVRMNGAQIDQFKVATAHFQRSWQIAVPPGTVYDMNLEVDHALTPASVLKSADSRELGLKLESMTWQAVR